MRSAAGRCTVCAGSPSRSPARPGWCSRSSCSIVPTFTLMWLAAVALARTYAPAGVARRRDGATAQGMFASITNSLGGSLGAVLGGRLYAAGGAVATFPAAAVLLTLVVPGAAASAMWARDATAARRPVSSR